MLCEENLSRLYESLDNASKIAVQEVLADTDGELDLQRFEAKYGTPPDFGTTKQPTALNLFMPLGGNLPYDLEPILGKFVPEPPPLSISSADEIPDTVRSELPTWWEKQSQEAGELRVRVSRTEGTALREFATMLRLVELGKVRVGDKTRRPSLATVEGIEPLLVDGDFYQPADRSQYPDDPGYDLAIRGFAWPCILQAAGLVSLSGGKLGLAPTGRKALNQPPQDGIRAVWDKWIKTDLFDEFERIGAIKGKQGARLTAVAVRRQTANSALKEYPVGRWISVVELFRILRASGNDFAVARQDWKLYIAELQYGGLGYSRLYTWELLQGRFVLAILFEHAATLGLIDVGYVPPQGARDDYRDHYGRFCQTTTSSLLRFSLIRPR
jgi:hypothetical protein